MKPPRLLVIALALLLAACRANPRYEAAGELLRLDAAMREHRATHGRFPDTIDPAIPATPANLPFSPEGRVDVRLAGVDGDRYQATAHLRAWNCWLAGGLEGPGRPRCAAQSSGREATPDAIEPPPPIPGVAPADTGGTAP